MSDDLRERIERRMREGVDAAESRAGELPLTATAHPAFDAAVSVCEAIVREERERWGRVARCQCLSIARHEPGCVAKKNRGEDCGPHYQFHDPRCAPQEAAEPSPLDMKDWLVIALAVLGIGILIAGALWVAWWSTGQFFSGSQHWAAFWILIILGASKCNCRKK